MADPGHSETDDGLARLRERLAATQLAAERLVEGIERGASPEAGSAEARGDPSAAPGAAEPQTATPDGVPGRQARAGSRSRPPPAGYAVPDTGPTAGVLDDLAALVRMVRTLVGDELARELAELARELLLLMRALIDWLVERQEHRPTEPIEVTDIPIA